MSLRVLTQGGSGGASASIFVTGLSEADSVTATKGGKTVNGVWTERTETTVEPLIPVMTSNTTPSGTASATSYNSGYLSNAYHAFDGDLGYGADVWYGQSYALATKIVYTFSEVQTNITEVFLRGWIDGGGTLTSGVIEYTEDGSTWNALVSLDTSNFQINADNFYSVSVDRMIAIRAGATASSNSRGLMISEFQVYGLADSTISGHEISPIKSYGTWTVTATDGEQTATQDVLVDAATEYEIEMSYKLWLYRDGDECEDVTGGFEFAISSVLSDNTYIASMYTKNKIDMTKYSKLYYEIQGTAVLQGGIDSYLGLGDGTLSGGALVAQVDKYPYKYYRGNFSREIRYLDLSDVNTALHFVIYGQHNAYYPNNSSLTRNDDSLLLDVWYNYSPGERQYTHLYNAWLE